MILFKNISLISDNFKCSFVSIESISFRYIIRSRENPSVFNDHFYFCNKVIFLSILVYFTDKENQDHLNLGDLGESPHHTILVKTEQNEIFTYLAETTVLYNV